MNRKLLKLPILTSIGSIIYHALIFIFMLLGYGGTWTPFVTTLLTYVPLILNIIILIVIGLILRKTYDRKTFLQAVTLLVIYSIVTLLLQQIALHFGLFNGIIDTILYLPISIFGITTSLLGQLTNLDFTDWIYAIISIFEPYILVLFSKNTKSIN